MSKDRITRVNQLLLRELGEVFTYVVSPAVPCLVTVTGVETASNLRDATVYVSIYGKPEQKQAAMDLIERKRPMIQAEMAHKIILKYTPVLHFKLDETAERADRVEALLRSLKLDGDNPTGHAPDNK